MEVPLVRGGGAEALVPLAVPRFLQVENEAQGCIDAAQLIECEMARAFTKAAGVDCGGLLGEHPSESAGDFDLGAKARRPC
jgi:hypothetical protein